MADIHTYDFSGKRALIRVDFNVPLDKETMMVTDDTRIRAAAPTIQHVLKKGGSVVLMSHLGRPKEGPEDRFSLRHIVAHTSKVLGVDVKFADDCIGETALTMSSNLKAGEVLMLENVRFHKRETTGTESFAEELAKHGDVYINDAFGTAHRAHASTAVIADYFPAGKKMFGLLMEGEVMAAEKVLLKAEKPFTAIIGGAKVSDKILIIENLLERATDIIIGGGMAYTFMKAMGGVIGNSLCEDDRLDTAKDILTKAEAKGVRIHLPSDSVIADKFAADANTSTAPSNNIPSGWMGLDIGANAAEQFKNVLLHSKTILWNGPMGVFEMPAFENGTKSIAYAVAEATKNGASAPICPTTAAWASPSPCACALKAAMFLARSIVSTRLDPSGRTTAVGWGEWQ